MATRPNKIVSNIYIYVCPSCNKHLDKDLRDHSDYTKKLCLICNNEMIRTELHLVK